MIITKELISNLISSMDRSTENMNKDISLSDDELYHVVKRALEVYLDTINPSNTNKSITTKLVDDVSSLMVGDVCKTDALHTLVSIQIEDMYQNLYTNELSDSEICEKLGISQEKFEILKNYSETNYQYTLDDIIRLNKLGYRPSLVWEYML